MPPRLRKGVLSMHLIVAVGWIGTVIAYLALGLTAASSEEILTVRTAWIGMELIGWFVIVPLALASMVTGLIMSLGTSWGLFRHYWVLFSFLLTAFATVILLLHMPDVSTLANVARTMRPTDQTAAHLFSQLRDGDLLHPALGLVILVTVQVLNVYKPAGLTRHGRRKQLEERDRARTRTATAV